MQVSRSPTARWTRTAATDESTPPERPQITRALGPTISLMRATSLSTKCPGVQSGVQPQTSKRKLLRISPPRGVWATSGWNCTPKRARLLCSIAAMGEFSLDAVTL